MNHNFNHNYYCKLIIIVKGHNIEGLSDEVTFKQKPER